MEGKRMEGSSEEGMKQDMKGCREWGLKDGGKEREADLCKKA